LHEKHLDSGDRIEEAGVHGRLALAGSEQSEGVQRDGFGPTVNGSDGGTTVHGSGQANCYTGKGGTAGVGTCHAGVSACTAGVWSPCVGQVTPSGEACNGQDDDCNGVADDGC
jgi:hypothetical protein